MLENNLQELLGGQLLYPDTSWCANAATYKVTHDKPTDDFADQKAQASCKILPGAFPGETMFSSTSENVPSFGTWAKCQSCFLGIKRKNWFHQRSFCKAFKVSKSWAFSTEDSVTSLKFWKSPHNLIQCFHWTVLQQITKTVQHHHDVARAK